MSAKAHGILASGVRVTGLSAPDAKPWHMKATYQLFNPPAPAETGSMEEWWTGPDQWRRTYTEPKDVTWTEWSVTRGRHFQSRADFQHHDLDQRVAWPATTPLVQARYFKPEFQMQWKQVNAGVALDCVSVVSPARYTEGVDPELLFPRLCFDAGSRLRFMGTADTTVAFNKYQPFQGRAVAYKIDEIVLGQKKASIDIDLLEPLSDQAMVKPDASAVSEPYAIYPVDPQPVPVYQVAAVIPSASLENNDRGTVQVPVILLKDGRVKLNGSPSGNGGLARAAADTIKMWRYEPYVVDGEVVEASFSVSYEFNGKRFVPQTAKSKEASNSGFDPRRDPAADLRQAEVEAGQGHKRILLEVGSDSCDMCGVMDKFYSDHPDVQSLRDSSYVTLKVNVSPANQNAEFLSRYPKVPSYPALLVLDADGKLLQAEDATELERGNGYNPSKVRAFLVQWKPS